MNDRYITSDLSEFNKTNHNPILGYEDAPILSFEETLHDFAPSISCLPSVIQAALENHTHDTHLTSDESAAIYLYTMSSPIFSRLNEALRVENRDALKPWFPFLKLFIAALEKLPSLTDVVWRGINCDDTLSFVDDDVHTWWSVNSCSKDISIIRPFLGDRGTLFAIKAINGKDISKFSANPGEQEVVLMPGSRVRRRYDSLNLNDQYFILHLEEVATQSLTRQRSNDMIETIKQNYLRYSYVERLINPAKSFPIEQSYINLAVVTVKEQHKKEKQLQGAQHNDTVLSCYEEIYGTKTAIDINHIFQDCKREEKQVLVFGRAGIGKSTFCRYIAYRWAQNLWSSQYEILALIPLRYLTVDRYPVLAPGKSYSLLDVFKREVFRCELSENEEKTLERIFDPKSIMWLLDGYDEIVQNVAPHLEPLLQKLLHTPHHIITSRPYMNTLSYEAQIEITGFTDENIVQYVQHFFCQMKDEVDDSITKSEALLKLLKANSRIWGIAHIPINLELMCSFYSNQDWSETERISITALYDMIAEWLCRRYLETQNYQILQISAAEIHQRCRDELTFLENLAFNAMSNNVIIIRPSLLHDVLKKTNICSQKHPHILNIGILKSFTKQGVGTQIELDKDHYFVHLSFQEYFAARHLMHMFQTSPPDVAIEFVRLHKYNRRYLLVFTFLAGLLSESSKTECLNTFWDTIQEDPLDLVGLRHMELILICLEETFKQVNNSRRQVLIRHVSACIEYNLLAKSKIILPQISQFLRKSQSVVCEETIGDMLVTLLRHKAADIKTEVLFFISSIDISNPSDRLIDSVTHALDEQSSDVKIYACEAIRTLGEKAATTKVINKLIKLLQSRKTKVSDSARYTLIEFFRIAATPETVRKMINLLKSKNYRIHSSVRIILDNAVEKIKTPESLNQLVDALQHHNALVRCNILHFILHAAKKLATTEIVTRLTDLLEDERDEVRQNACRILALVGEEAATLELLDKLVSKALMDQTYSFIVFACEALRNLSGQMVREEILAKLLSALRDPHFHMVSRGCFIIGQLGVKAATREIIDVLRKIAKDQNMDARVIACGTLVNMRDKVEKSEMAELLISLSDDENDDYRAAVCDFIGRINRGILTTELLCRLTNALKDESLKVQHCACKAIGLLGKVAATTETINALMSLLECGNANIQADVCEAIGMIGKTAVTSAVIDKLLVLCGDTNANIRAAALYTLEEVCGEESKTQTIQYFVEALRDKDTRVKEKACWALLKWSEDKPIYQAVDGLLSLLGDDSDRIRNLAFRTLHIIMDKRSTYEITQKLIDLLADTRVNVKSAVWHLLGRSEDIATRNILMKKLLRALDDADLNVRKIAYSVLNQLDKEQLSNKIIRKVVKATLDESIDVRVVAHLLLQKVNGKLTSKMINKLTISLNGDNLTDSRNAAELIGNALKTCDMVRELGPENMLKLSLSKFASVSLKNVSEDQLIQLFSTNRNAEWITVITKLALVRETAMTVSKEEILIYGRKEPVKICLSELELQRLAESFVVQKKKLRLFFD